MAGPESPERSWWELRTVVEDRAHYWSDSSKKGLRNRQRFSLSSCLPRVPAGRNPTEVIGTDVQKTGLEWGATAQQLPACLYLSSWDRIPNGTYLKRREVQVHSSMGCQPIVAEKVWIHGAWGKTCLLPGGSGSKTAPAEVRQGCNLYDLAL